MSIRVQGSIAPKGENSNPNVSSNASRVFPKPPPVITTPIKHFFKAATPQKTPGKPVVNSPSTFSALSKQLNSPKHNSPTPAAATTPKGKSPKRISVPSLDMAAPRASIADSRGERVSVMERPRESILAELASLSSRASILDTSRSSVSSEYLDTSRASIDPRGSISSRPSLIENRPSLLVLSPPPAKTAQAVPVNSKIQFYEKQDAIATGAGSNTIEYYEKLYNVGRPSTPGKREVVMKQDEWRTMLSGLIEQVQAKEELLEGVQIRIESLEETVDDCKRENIILREELREKNAELARLGNYLAQQTSDSSEEVEQLRAAYEELIEEKRVRDGQLALLRTEFSGDSSRQSLGGYDDDSLRNELELAFTEVDRLSKKLVRKNDELKSYKQKVGDFLGIEPRKAKRQSSTGWNEQNGSKKSRK